MLAWAAAFTASAAPVSEPGVVCADAAAPGTCVLRLDLPRGAGRLAYYAAPVVQEPENERPAPTTALLVVHGYRHDARYSLDAGLAAVRAAGLDKRVLVVAPLFQVAEEESQRCRSTGEMQAQPGDARWTCGGWSAGELSSGSAATITSFAALDALLADLARRWPSLRHVTLAGFSAGAQLLQHYIGFATAAPAGVTLRFAVASPGSWLYFDPSRPRAHLHGKPVDAADCGPAADFPGACELRLQEPEGGACARYDRWKYGTANLPARFGRAADAARERYRAADVVYLVGARDSGPGPGTADRLLDHSCAAELQGAYRLQRAQGYAAYVRQRLRPAGRSPLVVVPDCAHDVGCVLPSAAARPLLFD